MEKHSSNKQTEIGPEQVNGKLSRMGQRFHEEVKAIKEARLKNGKSKEEISTVKITNLIIRHKNWKKIFNDIIKLEESEVEEFGYG